MSFFDGSTLLGSVTLNKWVRVAHPQHPREGQPHDHRKVLPVAGLLDLNFNGRFDDRPVVQVLVAQSARKLAEQYARALVTSSSADIRAPRSLDALFPPSASTSSRARSRKQRSSCSIPEPDPWASR